MNLGRKTALLANVSSWRKGKDSDESQSVLDAVTQGISNKDVEKEDCKMLGRGMKSGLLSRALRASTKQKDWSVRRPSAYNIIGSHIQLHKYALAEMV